jgi:hypothetical protein
MKELVTTFISILILGSSTVLACVLAGKSTTKFDPEEFVFIGTVVGYTDAVHFDSRKANGSISPISATGVDSPETTGFVTYGLIIEVTESVYLPTKASTFEVFEYELRADCLVTGVSKGSFLYRFPVGSEVRVISKKAVFVPEDKAPFRIRLENRLAEDHSISLNTDPVGRRVTSASSIFDYKNFDREPGRDWVGRSLLPAFEIRKDLLRLSKAEKIESRNAILDRILHAPHSHGIDHGGIFKDNTGSESEYRRYFEAYLKKTDPEMHSQHSAYIKALDMLMARGHKKDEAEKALGKALEAGTEIEASRLFNASLKFLPKMKK